MMIKGFYIEEVRLSVVVICRAIFHMPAAIFTDDSIDSGVAFSSGAADIDG